MAGALAEHLARASADGLLPWRAEAEAALRFKVSAREVEAAALAAGLLPARYARNAGTFGLAGQRALHAARVVVAGCGGLGGYIVEYLARLGLGTILVADPEVFEESNLNRQLFATLAELGQPKVEAAARRVAALNPAVNLIPIREALGSENAERLLQGALAVADGLDSIPARLQVATAAARLGLPFVHAGVAAWYGQVATQAPGGSSLVALFRSLLETSGAEGRLGNQAFSPAFAAALEVAEICKIVLGLTPALADRLLAFDLMAVEFSSFPLG